MASRLPPEPLPPLPDPYYHDKPGPYAYSRLRDVCGSRISGDAYYYYRRRELMTSPGNGIVSCVHPSLEPWIGNVFGFDMHSPVRQPPREEWPLSTVACRVDYTGRKPAFELPEMTYFVDYSSFHSDPATMPTKESIEGIRGEFFPENAKLVLTFYNRPDLKLSLWTHLDFFRQPFLDYFDAVLMPDFSAYSNDPTPQYLIGERQMQVFAADGSREGVTVIPSIVWSARESLRRQCDFWLSQYPYVNTIRIDCYGHDVDRTAWTWRHLFAMEKYLQGMDHIRWIIAGITSGWAIRELNRIFPKGNYGLVAPINNYIKALRGSTDREWSARTFRQSIQKIEDMRSGKVVADAVPRPARWPAWPDADKSGSALPPPEEGEI